MRIHRLEITAFGPFPGTEVVDFEPLNAAGLFLLTGPTGAGKTSILDAVCFALYGAVPGDRNSAKSFKSDHAAAEAVPSVVMDLTVRGRRIRVRRQPGWSRPSRRAKAGQVDEKAKASVEELVGGSWVTHTTRVDEVGHLVTSLLGMNKDQFCQVVMLPQGEFQTFLSAGARERHDVLESLFRTHRFQAIERWLVEHRRHLDVECREGEAGLERILARVDEVLAGAGLPPLCAPDLTDTDYLRVLDAVRARTAQLAIDAVESAEVKQSVLEAAKTAQHALDSARALLELQQRHRDAQNRLTELVSAAGEVRRREREVLLARQAAAFEQLLTIVDDARSRTTTASAAVDSARAELLAVEPGEEGAAPQSLDAVALLIGDLQREVATLDTLLEVQDELGETLAAIRTDDDEIAAVRAQETTLVARVAELPSEVDTARAALDSARDALARLPAIRQEHTRARKAREATQAAVALADEATTVDQALVAAREVRADARDELHAVRARRIAGMAATLAGNLQDGRPCQVCGSTAHPAPARAAADHVTQDDEAEAEDVVRRADDAIGQLQLRRERIRADKAAADHAADGHTPESADEWLACAAAEIEKCAAEAATVPARRARLEALEVNVTTARDELAACTGALQAHEARRAERIQSAARLRVRIADGVGSDGSLLERRAKVRRRLDAATGLVDALRTHGEASAAERAAVERLDALVAGSVFATVRQVRDAVRSEADIASGEALNRAYAADRAAAERALADPVLVRAAAAPAPDLEVLLRVADQAAAQAVTATAKAGRLEAAAGRLEMLSSELASAVSSWQPLRVRRDRADHLSAMVNGTSRDNLTKTKLSHYVLAARLEQVVDAANLRLRGICGGRYELSHTVHRGVGDARGGLGLRVLDTYTGVSRDPATLSGGETFYVSLALALGLADLVNNEIGGAELSTLFVDEGFGTLDADTLDEVMDELDALRSGGRSVGLVSHLAELRIRVPAQLSVVRSPSGSRLDDSR